MDLRDAVDALKNASRLYGALATVGEAAESALTVVNHVDELKADVAKLQAEKVNLQTAISEARLAEAQKTADAKANGERTLREYADKIAALDAELKAAKDRRNAALQTAQLEADRGVRAIKEDLERTKALLAAERARVIAEHDAFIEQTKEHRERIEANTAALQEKLDVLRAQVAPLMR